MSNLFWLTDAQMARLQPFFPKSHGKPRVDGRRVLSGIVFINRNGLRWCDASREYGLGHAALRLGGSHDDSGGADIDDAPDTRALGGGHHIAGAIDIHLTEHPNRLPELEMRRNVVNRVAASIARSSVAGTG